MAEREVVHKIVKASDKVYLLNSYAAIGRIHGEPKSAVAAKTKTFYINFSLFVPKNAGMKWSNSNIVPCRMWAPKALEYLKFIKEDEVVKIHGEINTFKRKNGTIGWQIIVEDIEPWVP